MKKLLSLTLVFLLMLATVSVFAADGDVPDDLPEGTVKVGEGLYILPNGSGEPENAIRPNQDLANNVAPAEPDVLLTEDDIMKDIPTEGGVTRAQMAVIVGRMQCRGIFTQQMATEFSDVPVSHWASGYIYNASQEKFINGNGDGTFEPDRFITYDETITILVKLLGYTSAAESEGGYPDGYRKVAAQIGLIDDLYPQNGAEQCPAQYIRSISHTAMHLPVMSQTVYGSSPEYEISDGEDGRPYSTIKSIYWGISE